METGVEVCDTSEDDETVMTEVEGHMVEVMVTVGTVGELGVCGNNMEEEWERLVMSSVSLSSCSLLWGGWNIGGLQGWTGRHFTWKRP